MRLCSSLVQIVSVAATVERLLNWARPCEEDAFINLREGCLASDHALHVRHNFYTLRCSLCDTKAPRRLLPRPCGWSNEFKFYRGIRGH